MRKQERWRPWEDAYDYCREANHPIREESRSFFFGNKLADIDFPDPATAVKLLGDDIEARPRRDGTTGDETMTDIGLARLRLERAERYERDYTGQLQDGFRVETFGEYTVVDDGEDRWLVSSDDYAEGVEELVGDILDGKYDYCEGDGELQCEMYSNFCCSVGCIYSRQGSPSDPQDILSLDITPEVRAGIIEALALDDECAELLLTTAIESRGLQFEQEDEDADYEDRAEK